MRVAPSTKRAGAAARIHEPSFISLPPNFDDRGLSRQGAADSTVASRPLICKPSAQLSGDRLPRRLLELSDPPTVLYVQGELPRGPAVAIVGTRRPTKKGIQFARRLAAELSKQGIAILSGGAVGIDAAADLRRGRLLAGRAVRTVQGLVPPASDLFEQA